MKNEIKNSRFGFCAGGITTYEFALLHIPFVVICQYEHQIKTARAWEKNKMALNLGFKNKWQQNLPEEILLEISKNSTKFNSNDNLVQRSVTFAMLRLLDMKNLNTNNFLQLRKMCFLMLCK